MVFTYSKEKLKYNPAFSQKFLKLVEETKKRYDLVYEKDGFMILKRR